MLLQLKPVELEAVSSFWYLKFADYWAGPFSYIEVLQMLKSRKISRTQKARQGEGRDWRALGDMPEFAQEFVDEFLGYYIPKGRSFSLVRKYVRVKYNAQVLIVDGQGKVRNGICTELSAGGAKIQISADAFETGDEIKIQFFYNSAIKLKSFKAKAKVLRLDGVTFGSESEKSIVETYSVEFQELKPRYKKMLLKVIHKKIRRLAGLLRERNKSVVEAEDLYQFSLDHPYILLNP